MIVPLQRGVSPKQIQQQIETILAKGKAYFSLPKKAQEQEQQQENREKKHELFGHLNELREMSELDWHKFLETHPKFRQFTESK